MIKRTLYFGNPAYLSTRDDQLRIVFPDKGEERTIPIEDIGLVILDHAQVTVSLGLMAKLLDHNVAFITCNASHHPTGLMLNLDGHTLQSQKFRHQLQASKPLIKQLWQQTVSAKIRNQGAVLARQGVETGNMQRWRTEVKSGDSSNLEARAAVYYWSRLFPGQPDFLRDRYGPSPNNLLNYGYAILRATVARSLVGSGLLPTLGIHHRNQYNAYCLADDLMEPYRPYVDLLILEILKDEPEPAELTTEHKKRLLQIPAMDILLDRQKSPLMVGVQRTTASLARCFEAGSGRILYPELD